MKVVRNLKQANTDQSTPYQMPRIRRGPMNLFVLCVKVRIEVDVIPPWVGPGESHCWILNNFRRMRHTGMLKATFSLFGIFKCSMDPCP